MRWLQARGASPVTMLHLRHYAATAMLDAGESYRTVADILGNSENTLRLHYDGRTDVGKRKAISALGLLKSSGPDSDQRPATPIRKQYYTQTNAAVGGACPHITKQAKSEPLVVAKSGITTRRRASIPHA